MNAVYTPDLQRLRDYCKEYRVSYNSLLDDDEANLKAQQALGLTSFEIVESVMQIGNIQRHTTK